jgi:hypothetical protein
VRRTLSYTNVATDRGIGAKMRAFGAGLLVVATLCGAPTMAADLSKPDLPTKKELVPPELPSTWHFEATLDGWSPNMIVDSGIRTFPPFPVSANFFQLLQHLEGILPVSALAYNDNFIVGASVFWVRLGHLNGNFAPGDGSLGGINAGLTVNQTIANFFGGVRIPTAPDWSLYGTLGARVINFNGSLDLSVPVVGFSKTASEGKTWADPVLGLRGRHRIDDKWSVEFETDAGGLSKSATAQAYGGVAYKWNQYLTSSAGYRVFYAYDQSPADSGSGTFRFQQYLYGPQFNTTLTF